MIRMGIVGAGIMGRKYAALMKTDPRFEVTAVYDKKEERASEFGQELGVKVAPTLHDLLGEAIDAVYIATPDPFHAEIAIEAAKAGKHLLIEKPLATTNEDAAAIAEAVANNAIKVQVSFCNRANIPFKRAFEIVKGGEIGEVLSINGRLNDTLYVSTQMLQWASHSTPAWFLMSHTADLASWFAGCPAKTVTGKGVKRLLPSIGIDTYDAVYALIQYESGAVAVLEAAWVLPESMPTVYDFKWQVIGTKGTMFIDTQDQMLHVAGRDYRFQDTVGSWQLKGNLDAFAKFLEGAVPQPLASIQDGMENTRILVAVHESARIGEQVRLT